MVVGRFRGYAGRAGGWWLFLCPRVDVSLCEEQVGANQCCERGQVQGVLTGVLHGFTCVQEITGEFVLSCGSKGAGLGQFITLRGLSLSPNETHLLICDWGNHRVVVSDVRDGRSLRSLQGPAGTLDAPFQATVVPQTGQVLVIDHNRSHVVVFAGVDDDTVVRTLGKNRGQDPLYLPSGLAVLDGDVADAAAPDGPVAVVADTFNHRLALLRVRDGTVVRHVGLQGAALGQFSCPSAVTVVPARSTGTDEAWLVVADSHNHRVQVLTRAGTVVRVLQGDVAIKLGDWLPGVAVCIGTGEILVTDFHNHRVVSWRLSDGGGLRVVCGGVQGSEPGQLSFPEGMVVSGDSSLWVADYGNDRLSLFR
jgi:tripartite motif-containing protein 71